MAIQPHTPVPQVVTTERQASHAWRKEHGVAGRPEELVSELGLAGVSPEGGDLSERPERKEQVRGGVTGSL